MATPPLKILGVVTMMNAGGAQAAMIRLARQLRARGHTMDVCFMYAEAPVFAAEPHVTILENKTALSPLGYARTFFRLLERLRRDKPDAVVGFLPLGQVYGAIAGALAGVKVRIASQRTPGDTYSAPMRMLDRICGATPLYSSIVCVSDAVKDSFDAHPVGYRKKLRIVHNGIEWPGLNASQAEARARLGVPLDATLGIAIGRLKAQKNYPFMIECVARTPGLTLLIAGDGPGRAELEAQIAERGLGDRVRLLGNLDRAGVLELFAAADLFIQTSTFEGQSNALLEAMHAGVPAILNDVPAQRESTTAPDGAPVALLMPVNDLGAWSHGLARLRDDRDLRTNLAHAARALVESRFSLSRMIDGFEAIVLEQHALHR